MFEGEIEADESYFGGIRKGKRGRGAAGKVAVFGLFKRNGKVYTVVYQMLNQQHYCQLFVRKLSLTALFTLTLTVVMMCLMSANLVISASITVHILLKIITI